MAFVCSWLSFLSAFLFVSLLFETGSHCVILAGLQMPCRTGWTKHTLCLLSAEIKSQKNQARCLDSVFCFLNFVLLTVSDDGFEFCFRKEVICFGLVDF